MASIGVGRKAIPQRPSQDSTTSSVRSGSGYSGAESVYESQDFGRGGPPSQGGSIDYGRRPAQSSMDYGRGGASQGSQDYGRRPPGQQQQSQDYGRGGAPQQGYGQQQSQGGYLQQQPITDRSPPPRNIGGLPAGPGPRMNGGPNTRPVMGSSQVSNESQSGGRSGMGTLESQQRITAVQQQASLRPNVMGLPPNERLILDGYARDISNGFQPEKPRFNPVSE
jgi:hypothetical protein